MSMSGRMQGPISTFGRRMSPFQHQHTEELVEKHPRQSQDEEDRKHVEHYPPGSSRERKHHICPS